MPRTKVIFDYQTGRYVKVNSRGVARLPVLAPPVCELLIELVNTLLGVE